MLEVNLDFIMQAFGNYEIVFRQGTNMIQFVLWKNHSGGFVANEIEVQESRNQLGADSRTKKESIGCTDRLEREDDEDGEILDDSQVEGLSDGVEYYKYQYNNNNNNGCNYWILTRCTGTCFTQIISLNNHNNISAI